MATLAPANLTASRVTAAELAALAAALATAGLPVDDLADPGRAFWRFAAADGEVVGFGGLEIYGAEALLRSVVTLPEKRRCGHGRAVVAALEGEAARAACRTIYLLTSEAQGFFARLGYARCARASVPPAICATRQFATLCPASATVMVKRLG